MARQCTCGYTAFYRVVGADSAEYLDAWIATELPPSAGAGSAGEGYGVTPHGTEHGAGEVSGDPIDGWSLVRSPYQSRTEEYRCDSCDRVRSATNTGGTALFGGYYVDATDIFCFVVNTTADLASFEARVVAQTEAVDFQAPIFVAPGPPENAVPVHVVLQTSDSMPATVMDALFCTGALGLALADTYDIYLVNSSAGTEEYAGTFVFTP